MAKKAPATSARTTDRTRWGGGLLAVGSLLAMGTLSLFLLRPALMDPSQAARLAGIAGNPGMLQTEGYVGIFAYLVVAMAAFLLVQRDTGSKAGVPASAAWMAIGLGAMVLVGVEAVVATALSPVAAAAAANPALAQAVFGPIGLLAGAGVLAIGAGLLFAFWGEARAAAPAIPAIIAYVGVLGALLTIVGGLGFVTGVRELLMGFYGTYLAYLALLVLGARVAFPALRLSEAASAPTSEA
jgi:hypothetical protein